MAESNQRLLTPQEVAARLRVTVPWVQEMARTGEMPAIKLGRWWRFDQEAVEDWLRAHQDATYKRRTS